MEYQIPSSIDATGATDVTDQLNDWIYHVPDGTPSNPSVITAVMGSNFRCEYGIALGAANKPADHPNLPHHSRNNIILSLDGSRVFYTGTDVTDPRRKHGTRIVHIRGGEGVQVAGGTFSGPITQPHYDPSRESWHGVVISGSVQSRVYNTTITGVPGDFFYLTALSDQILNITEQVQQCEIFDNNLMTCGRQAITWNSAVGVSIRHNNIMGAKRVIFDSEAPSTCAIDGVSIMDNNIADVGLLFLQLAGAPKTTNNVTVQNNKTAHGHLHMILSGRSNATGLTVVDNFTAETAPFHPTTRKPLIHVGNWDSVTMHGNVDTGYGPNTVAIDLLNCPTAWIDASTLTGFATPVRIR